MTYTITDQNNKIYCTCDNFDQARYMVNALEWRDGECGDQFDYVINTNNSKLSTTLRYDLNELERAADIIDTVLTQLKLRNI